MNSDYKRYIEKKAEICLSADSFSADLYEKYDVKKGLRDSKGNGVVVGLTTVSEVNGTNKVDGVKVPCEGRLSGTDARSAFMANIDEFTDTAESSGFDFETLDSMMGPGSSA